MSTELTFEQRSQRDRLTFSILGTVAYYTQLHDAYIPDQVIESWKDRAAVYGLSEAAVSQTVEEVRQVLELMSKLNKKRVA